MNNTMRTGSSRQRGAAAAEYLGVITVVAALIAAIALGAPGIGTKVSGEIQAAICRILGQSCPAQDPFRPDGPCVTASSETSGGGGLTVFSVHAGGTVNYTRERRSDGKVQITLKGGAEIGGDFALGAQGGVEGGPLRLKEGAGANLEALLTGEVGQTYVFDNDEQANEFVDSLQRSVLDTLNPASNPLISLSPAAGIANGISGLLGGPHIGGPDFELPPAEETYVEVGPEVSVSGDAGAGTAYAGGSATTSGVVGAKFNHRTGERTIYIKVKGGAEGSAGVFPVGGSGGVEGEGMIAVTFDRDGNATKLALEGTGSYRGGFGTGANVENLDQLVRSLGPGAGGGASGSSETGQKYQLTAELDLTDPANAQAAGDLLRSIGQGALVSGSPLGAVNPNSAEAMRNLYQRFDQAGRISFLTYDTSQDRYGFNLSGGEGIKFGIDGQLQFREGTLTGAYYRVPGVGFVPNPDCGGGGG